MKYYLILITLVLLQNCSFDNRTGIWDSPNKISEKNKNLYSDFKTLSLETETFNQIKQNKKKFNIPSNKQKTVTEWKDIYYNGSNNFDNFIYNDINKLRFRSKKISKHKLNNYIISENDNLVTSDEKGNILVFSLNQGRILNKYNFYKNKYKKIKKNLNFGIDKNIVYVSDNIGYLYAYNLKDNKIIWAKNLKIPFRSNLKIIKDKIIVSTQDNNLYFFDKNGNQLVMIPSEETVVKNEFINNISTDGQNTYFLNTYGSIYSFNNSNYKMNWFFNLNQSLDLNTSNQFRGTELVSHKDKIVISSNNHTYILESNSGTIIHKKNFSSIIKPIILNNYLFLINKKNLLICMNMNDGKIQYSYNINKKIAQFLNIKKKKVQVKNIFLINDKLFIFLQNSFVLKFNIYGELEKINKLPTSIISNPLILNKSILYLDNKKKLSIVD